MRGFLATGRCLRAETNELRRRRALERTAAATLRHARRPPATGHAATVRAPDEQLQRPASQVWQ